jgi:hypothetical protein
MPDDGVHELALYERPALDLEAQPDEERRHRVEVRDGDADMVETSYVRHEVRPPGSARVVSRACRGPSAGERSRPALLDME